MEIENPAPVSAPPSLDALLPPEMGGLTIFALAVLAGAFIALGTIADKILAIIFPITGKSSSGFPDVTIGNALVDTLIPVTLGNTSAAL